jgi:hypothetical protein
MRPLLIHTHQAGVPGHVGGEDRGEAADRGHFGAGGRSPYQIYPGSRGGLYVPLARAFSEIQVPTGPGGVERGPLRGTGDFPGIAMTLV